MAAQTRLRVLHSISEIEASAWDALLGPTPLPFVRHAWLDAMESSGSASQRTGWEPQHLTLWQGETLVAAAPAYRKHHSMGEYVYDFSWAGGGPLHGHRLLPQAAAGRAAQPHDRAALPGARGAGPPRTPEAVAHLRAGAGARDRVLRGASALPHRGGPGGGGGGEAGAASHGAVPLEEPRLPHLRRLPLALHQQTAPPAQARARRGGEAGDPHRHPPRCGADAGARRPGLPVLRGHLAQERVGLAPAQPRLLPPRLHHAARRRGAGGGDPRRQGGGRRLQRARRRYALRTLLGLLRGVPVPPLPRLPLPLHRRLHSARPQDLPARRGWGSTRSRAASSPPASPALTRSSTAGWITRCEISCGASGRCWKRSWRAARRSPVCGRGKGPRRRVLRPHAAFAAGRAMVSTDRKASFPSRRTRSWSQGVGASAISRWRSSTLPITCPSTPST